MKILHIISSLASGGAEIYVRDLSKQMVVLGHEVCIAYVSDAKSIGRCPVFEHTFKDQLETLNIQFVEIGHECRTRLLRGGRKLRKIVSTFKPDIIHSHLYYGLFFKALSNVKTPTLYTHHNHRLGKGKFLYPFFNKIVDRFIGISDDCADVLKLTGAKDVSIIYNGVSIERLQIKSAYEPTDKSMNVLAVGSLGTQKNFILLINAVNNLLSLHPEWKETFILKIAGEGPLKDSLQDKINHSGLTRQIALIGNRNDVPELLHNADLFVMSSDYEGLPISLLEAMMTGVPVIVTDVGACRDVVESCDAGLVIQPRDVSALSSALSFMIMNPSQRVQMSLNAKSKSQKFAISTATQEHISLYSAIVIKA